jgi:ribulose-phosphate 3-epimerase
MNKVQFAASMMCADYGHLEREVKALESAGIDAFHIDIMDGEFVSNFGMGLHDLRYIRRTTNKSVEVHLMIREPVRYLDIFKDIGVDVLYVHPESEYHSSTTIEKIIAAGITPAIAINPDTSVESISELLYIVKRVLVMSVNPGHAGQVFLPYVGNKIKKLLDLRQQYNNYYEVFWDGSCSADKVKTYAPMGVKGFVLGTAALFGHKRSFKEILDELHTY